MAVKLETPSDFLQQVPAREPLPAHQRGLEESLQRGTRLLKTLAQAARAARLEAEVAELEAALAEARDGAGRRLERWLSQFDAAGGGDVPTSVASSAPPLAQAPTEALRIEPALSEPAQIKPASIEHASSEPAITKTPATAVMLAARAEQSLLGWAPYLVHARRRLQERARALPHPHATSATDETGRVGDAVTAVDEVVEAVEVGAAVNDGGAVKVGEAVKFGEAVKVGEAVDFKTAVEIDPVADDAALPEDGIDAETAEGPVDDSAVDLDLSQIGRAAQESQPAPQTNRPMLGSFSFSLVGHISMLAILFMITLKLPNESASLGSQIVSVAAPMDDVELTPEFDALEPIEMELDTVAEPSVDPSSNVTALADIEALAVDASSLTSATSGASSTGPSSGAMLSALGGSRGGGSRSGGGRGAPAMPSTGGKFFGAGAGGNFFCYVVDSSGSMRGKAWESAKAELVRSISTLSEKQRFYIVFFAKEMVAIPEPGGREPAAHGLAANKENIEHARRWIETVKLDRGGPPNDALDLAIAREPDAIYLLTDGVTQVDVCAFLRETNRTNDIISGEQVRVPIHAIAYHSLDGQQLLRRLAQENAGQFHYVPAQ